MSHDHTKNTALPACALCGEGSQQARALPCYRLRSCPFGGETLPEDGCPARNLEAGCWQCDWVTYFKRLPRGSARTEWRQAMLDACPACEVFALHREVMSRMVEQLRRA